MAEACGTATTQNAASPQRHSNTAYKSQSNRLVRQHLLQPLRRLLRYHNTNLLLALGAGCQTALIRDSRPVTACLSMLRLFMQVQTPRPRTLPAISLPTLPTPLHRRRNIRTARLCYTTPAILFRRPLLVCLQGRHRVKLDTAVQLASRLLCLEGSIHRAVRRRQAFPVRRQLDSQARRLDRRQTCLLGSVVGGEKSTAFSACERD